MVEAFKHSWNGYKEYAWGHDNVKPISRKYHEWFGLGLTIVDSLDTMYIMGLNNGNNNYYYPLLLPTLYMITTESTHY